MSVYLISDTHFGHKNIISYCNRPFSSVEEMDKTLIKNWNSVVKKEDTVYHLGDFAFGNKEFTQKIIKQLNQLFLHRQKGYNELWNSFL